MPVQKLGDTNEIWSVLDGIFACVIVDEAKGEFLAARDPIGVCSFYWGRGRDGSTWFSSEMKALQTHCETFDVFPPVFPTSNVLSLSCYMLAARRRSEVIRQQARRHCFSYWMKASRCLCQEAKPLRCEAHNAMCSGT